METTSATTSTSRATAPSTKTLTDTSPTAVHEHKPEWARFKERDVEDEAREPALRNNAETPEQDDEDDE